MKDRFRLYDKKWQAVIRCLALGRCEIQNSDCCTGSCYDGVHHMVGRGTLTTRYAVANGVAACYPCHMWAEGNPDAFVAHLKEHRPEVYHAYTEMRHLAGHVIGFDPEASFAKLDSLCEELGLDVA